MWLRSPNLDRNTRRAASRSPSMAMATPGATCDAQQMVLPISVADPTDGLYSATAWGKGQTADVHFQDGLIDIILGRRQLSEYDDLVKAWQAEAGEQVRKELMDSMAASKA